jgi:hypothetical protein
LTRAARSICVALVVACSRALCAGVAASAAAAPTPGASAVVPADWTEHQITFTYQGLTTSYSCEGLKEKMRNLLRYFGARPDSIRLRAYGCAGGPYRPSPVVNLAIGFATLAPSATGGAAAIPAAWIERDLLPETRISRDAPGSITRGDCELVQRFVATVLPSFTHEILHDLTRCIPKELNGTMPDLRVRVLAPRTDGHEKR